MKCNHNPILQSTLFITSHWTCFCSQVRLLLGEVPERAEFAVPGLSQPLQPYYEVTQAVRRGNLEAFAQVWVGGG